MDFGFALQHAVELRAKASRLELALSRDPTDAGLRLTLLSLQRRLKRAERGMEEAAILNESWVSLICDECNKECNVLLHIGQPEDYDNRWWDMCHDCLSSGMKMMEGEA